MTESRSLPTEWRTLPLKRIAREVATKEDAKPLDLPYVGLENIESWTGRLIGLDEPLEPTGAVASFQTGDVLFGKLRPYLAKSVVAPFDGVCTGELLVFRPEPKTNGRFLNYLLLTPQFIDIVNASTYGAKMPRANSEFIGGLPVSVPSFEVQCNIADFLDRETAKIDGLIDEKERLLKLLGERRQALITESVTRGLDPTVPMKPSGLPWLGDIPAHWKVLSLGKVTLDRCDGPFGSGLKSEHYVEEGIRVVRLQNIKSGFFDGSDAAFISPEYYATLGDHSVEPEDVLIAGLGDDNNPVGRACVAPNDLGPAMVKADCFRYRLDRIVAQPTFVAWHLSSVAAAMGGAFSTGTTRARMNLSSTSQEPIVLPPVPEQEAISQFIRSCCHDIQLVANCVEQAANHLKCRRSALIHEAVTGGVSLGELR